MDLEDLNETITQKEDELQSMYFARRGHAAYSENGKTIYAYCTLCGKYTVPVLTGHDTCSTCLKDV